MLHCTSFIDRLPVSLVTVKKAPPLGDKGEGRIKIRGAGRGGVEDGEGAGGAHGGSSSLVVVGRISEGKLQPVGLGQEYAHFLVAPVHRG